MYPSKELPRRKVWIDPATGRIFATEETSERPKEKPLEDWNWESFIGAVKRYLPDNMDYGEIKVGKIESRHGPGGENQARVTYKVRINGGESFEISEAMALDPDSYTITDLTKVFTHLAAKNLVTRLKSANLKVEFQDDSQDRFKIFIVD